MNTLTADLKTKMLADAAIAALVDDRIHAELAPVELATPYITIASNVEERLTDLSKIGGTAHSRVMVTCWNGLGGELSELSQAVVDSLGGVFKESVAGTYVQTMDYLNRREVQGPLPNAGPVPVEGIELTFDCWHEE